VQGAVDEPVAKAHVIHAPQPRGDFKRKPLGEPLKVRRVDHAEDAPHDHADAQHDKGKRHISVKQDARNLFASPLEALRQSG
jgi:hypothetical protein